MLKLFIKYLKKNYFKIFPLFEEEGLHLTYNHFYSPIPDTRFIKRQFFNMEHLNVNIDNQYKFFMELVERYSNELDNISKKFIGNNRFDGLDAFTAYLVIRHFKPANIIEIGSGYSTILQSNALERNKKGKITCIEPFPDINLKTIKYVENVYQEKLENVDINIFALLKENDILFIDSSHVVKAGSDVLKIFTEILPVLNKGVIIHFHDIFLPLDYPLLWLKEEYRFWNEQYFLYNFLLFNSSFETIFANSYLGYKFPKPMKNLFPEDFADKLSSVFKKFYPEIEWFGGGSYWIRKI